MNISMYAHPFPLNYALQYYFCFYSGTMHFCKWKSFWSSHSSRRTRVLSWTGEQCLCISWNCPRRCFMWSEKHKWWHFSPYCRGINYSLYINGNAGCPHRPLTTSLFGDLSKLRQLKKKLFIKAAAVSHGHRFTIRMLRNWHAFATVTVSYGHVITFCELHNQFPTSRINGESKSEIASCSHKWSCSFTTI